VDFNFALIKSVIGYLMLEMLCPALVLHGDMYDLMLVQRFRHGHPKMFQVHLMAFVGVIVRPLQPGTFVRFPLSGHTISQGFGCLFLHNQLLQRLRFAFCGS
jgi:hypothetical protein